MTRFGLCLIGIVEVLATAVNAQGKSTLKGEQALADFARCVVRDAPHEAASFIDTTFGSNDEVRQLASLLKQHGKCLELPSSLMDQELAAQVRLGQITLTQALGQAANHQTQMTFSRQAFRGAIAERLYLVRSRSGSVAPVSADLEPDNDEVLPTGYVIVRCAAARDPAAADRLVRSERLSRGEAEAARALTPTLQDCARGKGRVNLSGTAIHGWMAEALYKQRGADTAERR